MLTLSLHNGSHTKEAWNADSPHFIDDWKPQGRMYHNLKSVSVAYACHIKAETEKGDWIDFMIDSEGFVVHDNVYYGDFTVTAEGE